MSFPVLAAASTFTAALGAVCVSNAQQKVDVLPDADVRYHVILKAGELNGPRRIQQIVAAERLPRGPVLVESLALRPMDPFRGWDQRASSVRWQVRLGYAARTPRTMSQAFAENRQGALTQVFDGSVQLPATSRSSYRRDHSIQVEFDTSFSYQPARGDLLVEIVEPTTNYTGYYLEVEKTTSPVAIDRFGRGGKIPRVVTPFQISGVSFHDTKRGFGVVEMSTYSYHPTVFMLGPVRANPLPLDGFGASGNTLYVDPVALLAHTSLHDRCPPGVVFKLRLDVPQLPKGVRVGVQSVWLGNTNELGVSTSNGAGVERPDRIAPFTQIVAGSVRASSGRYLGGNALGPNTFAGLSMLLTVREDRTRDVTKGVRQDTFGR